MKFFENKILVLLSAFFIALITFSAGYLLRDIDILPPIYEPNQCGVLATDRAFFEVLEELMENHYTQPEREVLINGAIEGMIEALDDPFSRYFDLEEAEKYQAGFGETYVGIGVTVRYEHNLIVVEDIKREGPAYDVGLRIGDVITHVDGTEVYDLSFYEAVGMIIGDVGTEVVIGIYRNGYEETLYFPIIRQVIENSSVEYQLLEEDGQNIGYIKVTQFGNETYTKFANAINNLENMGIDSMIIDLRDNGGGHLTTVYFMLNEFLVDDGEPIFNTEYYSNGVHYRKAYHASNEERKDYNIVTLINENSASASEVFASAMKEHGGYPLIGVTSYGKGTMQTDKVISATVGDSLHITIGKWTTSDGGWVHYDGGTDGITPDIVVEKTETENAYKVFLLDEDPIMFDSVDPRVANIQVILNMMGYTVRQDGYFDLQTRIAIEDIQTNAGITVTGVIDEATLGEINNALHIFIFDIENDTQLQAAIDYILENPNDPNE